MWVDAAAVLLILISAWKGAARGAVWQLAVIGSIVACILVAGELAPHVEAELPFDQPLKHWVAVGAVYAGVSLVVFLIARLLRGWLEKVRFIEYDRHWGAILGAVKGGAIVLVLTGTLLILAPSTHEMIRESVTGAVADRVVKHAAPLLPPRLVFALQRALNTDNAFDEPLPVPEPVQLSL